MYPAYSAAPALDRVATGPRRPIWLGDSCLELVGVFDRALARKGLSDADINETIATIDGVGAEFCDKMGDSDAFGPGKRIALAMQRDGVELEDAAAVLRWIDDFNRRPIEDRDDVLGPLPPGR